jgi:hypothetical protein
MTTFPNGDCPLLIRSDFSDAAAWAALLGAVLAFTPEGHSACPTPLEDRAFDGADPLALAERVTKETHHRVLLIADRESYAGAEPTLLCPEIPASGRMFRLVLAEACVVENNLSCANMSWEEFWDEVDADGVLRPPAR